METGLEERSVRLAADQTLRLRGAAGWAITCCAGTVWITQEGDPRDIFLGAGESFTLDRAGLALIYALKGMEDSWRGNTGMTVVYLCEPVTAWPNRKRGASPFPFHPLFRSRKRDS